jgi:uncharacterized protein YwqG
MMDSYLYRQMRRCNRNLMILALIFFCTAFLVLCLPFYNYWIYNAHPKELDVNKVLTGSYTVGLFSDCYYTDIHQKNYIDTGTEDFTTNLKMSETSSEIKHSSDYILVPYNDYWLPIRFDDKQRSIKDSYKGQLVGINEKVFSEIKDRASKKNIEGFDPDKVLNAAIEPAAAFNLFIRIDFWIGVIFLFLSLKCIINLIIRYISPYKSPVFAGLQTFGDIPALHDLIDAEVENDLKVANKVLITKSWFLSQRFLTLDIVPVSFIAGMYIDKKWKFIPFTIIPIYRSTTINIILRNKVQYATSFISTFNAGDIIAVLKEVAPWIANGDAKSIKKQYKQDFRGFLNNVDTVLNQYEYLFVSEGVYKAPKYLHNIAKNLKHDDKLKFMKKLHAYGKTAWRPVTADNDGGLTDSKFSGIPYLHEYEEWPVCPNCKKPMQLFVQLNMAELPQEFIKEMQQKSGLLQMFYCINPDSECENDCEAYSPFALSTLVRIVEPDGTGKNAISSNNEDSYPAKTIVSWEEVKDYPSWEELGEMGVNLTDEEMDDLNDMEITHAGDKLGGWPHWVQGVEYPVCPRCNKQMHLLFQIDSEDNLPHMFGDSGCGHITQCPEHKDVLAFSWACC